MGILSRKKTLAKERKIAEREAFEKEQKEKAREERKRKEAERLSALEPFKEYLSNLNNSARSFVNSLNKQGIAPKWGFEKQLYIDRENPEGGRPEE